MNMTVQEAIRHISLHLKTDVDCCNIAAAKGYWQAVAVHKRDMEAHQIVLDALREKAEREDPKPLTIEELKQMDGEPVYIYGVGWRINHGILHFMSSVFLYTGPTTSINITDLKGSIYRYKPKEVQE